MSQPPPPESQSPYPPYPPYPPYGYPYPGGLQPPYGYHPYGQPPWAPGPANGLGTAGMVLGIVGIPCCILLVPSILALVFGLIGRGRANRGEATNHGQAIAAIVLGIVGLLIGIGWVAAAVTVGTDHHHTVCQTDEFGDQSCSSVDV